MKNRIALIHELIEAYDLTSKCRDRGLIYKRAYLYHELRTSGFSLSQIGEIFGKHHATIIHGLRTHKNLTGTATKIINTKHTSLKNS
jgi:chromosomal replication initiation ATPase DnaA